MTIVSYTFNFLNLPNKVLRRKLAEVDVSLIVEKMLLL